MCPLKLFFIFRRHLRQILFEILIFHLSLVFCYIITLFHTSLRAYAHFIPSEWKLFTSNADMFACAHS